MRNHDIEKMQCPTCAASIVADGTGVQCIGPERHCFAASQQFIAMSAHSAFEDHWSGYEKTALPPSKILAGQAFLAPLLEIGVGKKSILDVGCGDGVHAHVLEAAHDTPGDTDYTGIDISTAALTTARGRSSHAVLIHADALNIPMKDNVFDTVFSYGVLAYTDDPEKGVREMARVTKPGGLVGLWLCPRESGLGGAALDAVRTICQRMGPWATRRIADIIVLFLPILPVRSGVNLKNASWKQCAEVVLVNIQPQNLIFPNVDDVLRWFERAGLSVQSNDSENPITIWATKDDTAP